MDHRGCRFVNGRGALQKRRHLNAGQRAILFAVAYPMPTPGKRTDLGENPLSDDIVTKTLSQARAIVNEARDLVDQVIAGGMYFKTAFEEAEMAQRHFNYSLKSCGLPFENRANQFKATNAGRVRVR
jgi:hypothetical protein